MADTLKACRVLLHLLGLTLTLAAISMLLSAVLTSAWQVVDIEESRTLHYHGLWLNCVRRLGANEGTGWACTYNVGDSTAAHDREHQVKQWQIAVLAMLCGSVTLSLIGSVFACLVCCPYVSSVVWAAFNALATVTAATGVTYYYVKCNLLENKIIVLVTSTYAQHVGYSFWIVVGGTGCLVGAFFASLLSCVALYARRRRNYNPANSAKVFKAPLNTSV